MISRYFLLAPFLSVTIEVYHFLICFLVINGFFR